MAILQIRPACLLDMKRVELRYWEEELVSEDWREELIRSFNESREAYAVSVDGELCLLIGHCGRSMFLGSGLAWMFATPASEQHWRMLTRFSKRVVNGLGKLYPEVYVATYPGHTKAIRWLEWLGFKQQGVNGNTLTMMRG